MDFNSFVKFILECSSKEKFGKATEKIIEAVNALDRQELIDIVKEIGIIPECIEASSTQEKLYSKASDCLLARCFIEMGLSAEAVKKRGNSADITATSVFHPYSLVADAKTFRLSRTAINQKDFKIDTLSKWKGSQKDYALLVAPYFQYPNTSSQIYSSALSNKVCLFSWEHIWLLLKNDIRESETFSLDYVWRAPGMLANGNENANSMDCHLPFINNNLCYRISCTQEEFAAHLNECKDTIYARGLVESTYLNKKSDEICEMTKEQAISELLNSKKINERISTINKFVNGLKGNG